MPETTAPKFTKIQCRGWQERSRYRVSFDGRRTVGVVVQRQDSSKTGGMWSAQRPGLGWSSGHATRTAAAEALR